MQGPEAAHPDRITVVEEAIEHLFANWDSDAVAATEPRSYEEAAVAVRRLNQILEDLPEAAKRALRAAAANASLLSSDRFQGLSEIVQNADDAGASQVQIVLRPKELLVSHDGRPVRLNHVIGFATPWLSTKGGEVASIGRFGIGLMTLRSLSSTTEVHSAPYHVRLNEYGISPIEQPVLPAEFQLRGWTKFRIPLEADSVTLPQLVEWLDRWDDAALLFLNNVSRVALFSPEGKEVRRLSLTRSDHEQVANGDSKSNNTFRQYVETSDKRSMVVYSTSAESPPGVQRAWKTTGESTPISVAFPLQPTRAGKIHAGLPVASSDFPLFVSAQFDPLTSRLAFGETEWNKALIPLVARLWAEAALDHFSMHPVAAWHAMPIMKDVIDDESSIVRSLEDAIIDHARTWLASRVTIHVSGQGPVALSKLAVEAQPLEGILSESEVATLAGLPATLPFGKRDQLGAWRAVLEDWRSAGSDLPEPVSVERSLTLLGDETRSPESTIALTATALSENLAERLFEFPCVIATDGRHIVPPSGKSPNAVSVAGTPLAQQLRIVTILHPAHMPDEKTARQVREWLVKCGALIDGTDNRVVVNRLAVAGRSGHKLQEPLTNEQVQTLRDAFELMDRNERQEIGADVGRAILLEGYTYKGRRRTTTTTSPVDAYVPGRIDRDPESFAIAAGQTPGLVWLSEKYAAVLRSPSGRAGVGALQFLRMLGANSAPLPRLHRELEKRFAREDRRALARDFENSPTERRDEMRRLGATYTLQDYDNPDLLAVAENISRERRKRIRRKRSGALLGTLGRAWQRSLSNYEEVDAAYDNFYWRVTGQLRAYWLWQLGNIPWVDDESGTRRRPLELRLRTSGSEAIYGIRSPDFIHKDLGQTIRHVVIRAIGVSGDPSRSELIDRLRELRDDDVGAQISAEDVKQEAALLYKALAGSFTTSGRSYPNAAQVRREFESGRGLLLSNKGWLPPRAVLAGPSIFRDYRAFAPQAEDVEPLWRVLNLREPSQEDCLKVLQEIGRKRSGPSEEDRTILLETLRKLASLYQQEHAIKTRQLRELALWTSKGWARYRPVYVTEDIVLAKGLRDQFPIWEPGGDLEQFRSLLPPMRVEEVSTRDAEVIDPSVAYEDPECTDLFQKALELLEEDLARNEPELEDSLQVPWATLSRLSVRVHPSLSLCVQAGQNGEGHDYVSDIDAKVDIAHGCVFIRHPSVLPRVEGGGRALAALFRDNRRRIAHAWRAACDKAEEGILAHPVELAHQIDEQDRESTEQGLEGRLESFRERTGRKNGSAARSTAKTPPAGDGKTSTSDDDNKTAALNLHPRVLVDPGSLKVTNPQGRIDSGSNNAHRKDGNNQGLAEPKRISNAPRNRTSVPTYTSLDRESVGMKLLEILMSSDDVDIVDLRAQHRVGADATHSTNTFYELKVFAGAEPDQVTLTNSEVRRAMSTPDFFLIVVSEIEGVDARPKVRVFADPLKQLRQTHNGSITLSGVKSADKSLLYEFEPIEDAESSARAVGSQMQ